MELAHLVSELVRIAAFAGVPLAVVVFFVRWVSERGDGGV
jgi:hypothetical protein